MMSRFLDGGIDIILLQYLKALDPSEYDVTLAIASDMGGLEVHSAEIPRSVRVVHLAEGRFLNTVRRNKILGKAGGLSKIADEIALNPLRLQIQKQKLKSLAKGADYIIDFDAANYSLLKGIDKPKIGFYHFSLAENMVVSPRHTRRQMAGMKDYSYIVLVCDAMKEEAERMFPRLAPKFRRIYNGYDFEEFRARAIPAANYGRPYFVSVARLEESQKDITTLIKAYSRFKNEFSKTHDGNQVPALRLIGKGHDEEKLKKLALECGLEIGEETDSKADVVFVGFCENPAPTIAGALALVLSSHYEGFGMVLLEAQILSTPAIATDCPVGPAEILEEGRTGILVKPMDEEGLSDALMRVAEDRNLEEIRKRAEESVGRFEIKKSIEDLSELLT